MDHSLLDDLISWSNISDVPPVPPQPDFEEWSRFVALVFCHFASLNHQWAWEVIDLHPSEIVQLSPWISSIEIAGVQYPPESMTLIEWLQSAEIATLIDYGSSISQETIELCNLAPPPIKRQRKPERKDGTFFESEAA